MRIELSQTTPSEICSTSNELPPSTPSEICPTSDLEKYINGNMSRYFDAHINSFWTFKTGAMFKYGENTLVAGAQGEVYPGQVITPNRTRSYPLVQKTGKETTKREVELLRAIKKNTNKAFPFHLIQRIQGWKIGVIDTCYFSRHEKGGDLQQHQANIQQQCQHKNPAVLGYVFNIMSQLIEGLAALHNGEFTDSMGKPHAGIVHNDLKPANIFVRANGDVIIADFGCGYFADDVAPQYATLNFAAPELFLASTKFCTMASKNAAKSDIFSLGLTLALLLQGNLPEKRTADDYVIPRQLPKEFAQFTLKKWAEVYENSEQCKKAQQAKKYLQAQASRYAHEKFWPSCPQN